MKLFYDDKGELNYDRIDKDSTVKELLDAVDVFLDGNPLPCNTCEDNCCKRTWSVEADNIYVNKLCGWNDKAVQLYVRQNLAKKKNYCRDFDQYVLKKVKNCPHITETGQCSLYEIRPVICRLYVCCSRSRRYDVLREMIGITYLKALILEDRANNNQFTGRTIKKYKRNPAFLAREYDALLEDILRYAETEGWMEPDEKQLLQDEL